jgi:nuclear pore complex protein Nup54
MVPVPAIGFQDLQKRIKAQSDTAELHLNNLQVRTATFSFFDKLTIPQSFSNRLSALTSTHITKTTPALALIQLRQRTLSAQLTLIVTHLHMLIPTVRSTAIKPEEEKLREVLEDIKAELGRPGGIGRVGGKMGVLWGLIGKIKGDREASAGNTGEDHIWEVVDEQGLQEITKVRMAGRNVEIVPI